MEEPKKVFVSIYCKIYNDSFSPEMVNRMATGKEIHDFLLKDAGLCRDDNDQLIPGDCNLWYLGCNEKFGCLRYQDKVLSWEFGESSFSRITIFLGMLYRDKVLTCEQFQNLFDKTLEGRQVDCMYDIKDHLLAKKAGKPWVKTKRACEFRTNIKGFVARMERHFQQEEFLLFNPATTH